jgi:hypothetical protein
MVFARLLQRCSWSAPAAAASLATTLAASLMVAGGVIGATTLSCDGKPEVCKVTRPPQANEICLLKISPKVFDHTALKPEVTVKDITKLCAEAREHGFYSVCVNSHYVPLAAKLLAGSDVKVCAVVGFPLGANLTASKVTETQLCIEAGATEIDMVANNGLLKSGRGEAYLEDIAAVAKVCHAKNVTLKVCFIIFERFTNNVLLFFV